MALLKQQGLAVAFNEAEKTEDMSQPKEVDALVRKVLDRLAAG
jgi:hypothetical protein